MTSIDTYCDEMAQGRVAREEYIRAFMQDVPTIYSSLMPVSVKGEILQESEKRLREQWEADVTTFEAERESPWIKVGPKPRHVEWSKSSGDKAALAFLKLERTLGLPGLIKQGSGPDGILYSAHHEVTIAKMVAHRTMEFSCSIMLEEAEKRLHSAQAQLTAAMGQDEQKPEAEEEDETAESLAADQTRRDGLKALAKKVQDARHAFKETEKKFKLLRADPAKGCKVVWDGDQSPDAVREMMRKQASEQWDAA